MTFVHHHVFCDESGKFQADPLIAFCAVSATADRLNSFDKEWEVLLRSYELDSLHMERASRLLENVGYRLTKGQTIDERSELLYPFADCINKYLEMGVIQAWDVRGLNHLPKVLIETLGGSIDPFFMALIRGFGFLIQHFDHENDRISVIVDDDPYTAWDSYNHYRSYGKADPMLQKMAISLTFANDKHFPALQAADMLAFLGRHEANEQFNGVTNIWRKLFDRLVTEPQPPYGIMRWYKMFADEELLFEMGKNSYEDAERAAKERRERRQQRIPKLQSVNDSTNPSSTQSNKSQTGSGETTKAEG